MAVINLAVAVDAKAGRRELDATAKAVDNVGASAAGAQPKLSSFQSLLVSGLGAGAGIAALHGLSSSFLAVAAAAAAAVKDLAKYGSDLADLSARTGVSTTALQELSYAGSLVGVSMEQITGAMTIMEKNLANGSEAFAKLGLDAGRLLEMAPSDAFKEIGTAIAGIKNPAEQTAAAMAIFGRSGAAILALLKSGLADVSAEAHLFGGVIGEDTVQAADQLDDALTRLDTASGGLSKSLAALALETGATQVIEDLAVSVGALAKAISDNKGVFADYLTWLGRVAEATPGAVGNIAQGAELAALALKTTAVLAPGKLPTVKTPATFEPGPGLESQLAGMQTRALQESNRSLSPEISKVNTLLRDQAQALKAARLEAFELTQQIETVGDQGMEGLGDALLKASTSSLTLSSATQTVGLEFGSVTVSAEDMAAAVAGVNAAELASAKAATAAATATFKARQEALAHTAALERLAEGLAGMAFVIGTVNSAFLELGGSADSALGKVLPMLEGMTMAAANFAGAMAKGDLAGMIGAGIQGATSLAKGIIGLFKSDPVKSAQKEAGRILGVGISRELAEEISKSAKALGISIQSATLIALPQAIAESGQSAADFAGQIGDLMGMIALGGKGAEEGMLALDDVFSQVRESAQGVGDAMTVAMLQAAEATGTLTDGMREFVSQQNQLMATGAGTIGKALEGLGSKQLGGEMGTRAAQFFAVGFQAAIEEQGLLGAIDSLGDQALSMFKKFQETGNTTAAALLAPFAQLEKAIGGDSPAAKGLRSQLELLQGMGDVFEGAFNQGLGTAELAQAFGAQMLDTFNAMTAKSVDSKTAMTAIMPELQNAVSAARELGLALDPATQGLVDQATAMGFSFPVEPMQQVVDLLKVMVTTLGGELPASVQQTSSAMGAMQGATTSSLGAMQTAAMETSSTMAAAFDGVGAEITTAIAPAAGAIESQLAAAFDAGILGAQNLATLLGQLDSTTLTIPFKFTGEGGGPNFGIGPLNIPTAAKGLTVEPKPGGQLLIAGEAGQREHVIPDSELKALLKGSGGRSAGPISVSQTVHVSGAADPEAVGREVMRQLDINANGFVTKIKRALDGRR